MFKKVFQTKRKRQEPPGRHNTNKITFDPASAAILNRHFSPLSCRAKSPSDVLDIVGYPLSQTDDYSLIFSPLSPETPFKAIPEQPSYRLTIRNNPTPNQLLETSREDKTLVEVEDTSIEIYRLQQKLIKLEQEKEAWNIKLQGYIEREEQMRELINQLQISRNNSFKTVSTHSSAYLTEEEEEEDPEDQEIIYSYYTDYYPKSYPYYYNDYYYNSRHQQYYYYD